MHGELAMDLQLEYVCIGNCINPTRFVHRWKADIGRSGQTRLSTIWNESWKIR